MLITLELRIAKKRALGGLLDPQIKNGDVLK